MKQSIRFLFPFLFVFLFTVGHLAQAGTFSMYLVSYNNFTNSAGSYLTRVDGWAKYRGQVDANDRSAVIWTSLNWEPGDLNQWNPPDLQGPGEFCRRPFSRGQVISCVGGCTANHDLPKAPCLGAPLHIKYKGRGQVVIPHGATWEGSIMTLEHGQVPCDPDFDPCYGFSPPSSIPTELVRMSYEAVSIEPLKRPEGYTHGRAERRDRELFTMDSWAVTESGAVESASGAAFAGIVQSAASPSAAPLLMVEAPVHPHNSRWVPRPSVRLERVGRGPLPATRAFARIEFNPDGSVYSGSVLRTERPLSADEIAYLGASVRGAAKIDFATSRTHRAVAYLAIDSGRGLSVLQQAVVLLRCWCGGP